MESLNDLKTAIDGLISVEEGRINVLRQVKLLLNSDELNALNEFNLNEAIRNQTSKPGIIDDNYPKRGSKIIKINYLLIKEGKATRSVELLELIARNETISAANKAKGSLSGTLYNMVARGILACYKYNNDKKLAFYVKPEWVGTDGVHKIIKPEHCPSPEILAGIPEEKLKPELITWHESRNNF